MEYATLEQAIDANIIPFNNAQLITGEKLNIVLHSMVEALGQGYQYMGLATPTTNPGTPDPKVFYIANGKGTYTNFGGVEVAEDDVVVLYWDSAWHKVSTGIASQEKLSELDGDIREYLKDVDILFNKTGQPGGNKLYDLDLFAGEYTLQLQSGSVTLSLVFLNESTEVSQWQALTNTNPVIVNINDKSNKIKIYSAAGNISFSIYKGAKIPSQITELADKVKDIDSTLSDEHDEYTNLIDKTKVSIGYVKADGNIQVQNGFFATDFIPVESGMTYHRGGTLQDYTQGVYNGYYAFYREDKTLLEGHGADASLGYSFTIPNGAKFARFTIVGEQNLQHAWVSNINRIPSPYKAKLKDIAAPVYMGDNCDYIGDEFSLFNRGLCIGDSLTDGFFNESGGSRLIIRKYSYPTYLSKISGVNIENWGYAGYTSKQWNDAYNDDEHDWSGFDFAIIQLGVNDALINGGWTNESKTAFTNIVSRLKTDNKGIKIYVATIMPAKNYRGTAIDNVSQGIRNFVAEMADDNVILLDMAIFAHTGESIAMNAGHLSAYGYWQLAKDYKAIIGYHIRTNPQLYKFVQFIGTNYEYSE